MTTRNFKKLAGPGFHVNVRFDDAHMRLARNARGSLSLQNRGFDKVHSAELFDIKEGELLIAKKQSLTRDGYARCFSSLNGYDSKPASGTAANLADLRKAVFDECVFMGVATTDFKSDDPAYIDQGFVAQTGGVVTVRNFGPDTLHPGDKVRIDIRDKPLTKVRKGIPPLKERLVLRKATPTNTLESIGLDNTLTARDDILKDALNALHSASERVIGKAMSYAKTGDTVDILLLTRSTI